MRLSIIVPVYNVEKYISRCIESFYNQNLSENEFEIIIVNDGSTDNSLKIIDSIAANHSNIRVISQPNRGPSAARNLGLKYAEGEYIWFVDSDDFADNNTIKNLLINAENNTLDVQCFSFRLFFENGNTEKFTIENKINKKILTGNEFITKSNMPPAVWLALFRRNFLLENNLWFLEGVLHEDQEFSIKAYYLAKKIEYCDSVVINYFQREGSIMKSNNPIKCKSLLIVSDSLYKFKCEKVKDTEIAAKTFDKEIAFVFSQSLYHYQFGSTGLSLKDFRHKKYYPLKINELMNKKEKLKTLIINLSLPLYLFILKLINK